MTTETLLLGGRGQIGSGLRTYLPRLDTGYRFTSVDLPGAANRAEDLDDPGYFVDLDISAEPQRLVELTPFATLLTVVIALGLMASRHELVILRGAGLSPARIAGTVFKAGVALLVIMLCVQSFVAPPLLQKPTQRRHHGQR